MTWLISISVSKILFVCFTDNSCLNNQFVMLLDIIIIKSAIFIAIFINHLTLLKGLFVSLTAFEEYVIILEYFNTILSLCCHHSLGYTCYSPLSLPSVTSCDVGVSCVGQFIVYLFSPPMFRSIYLLPCSIYMDLLDLILIFFSLYLYSLYFQ